MANLLGVPSYDPTLDREVRQFNSELLQNLGKQIRQDVTTIQTNRQLQGLAQGLQQVDPATPQFGKSVISLMTQYPLATKTPIGQAAISQLGAEHKFWQQEQLYKQRRGDEVGMAVLRDAQNNRPYGASPMTRPEAEAIVSGLPVTPGASTPSVQQPAPSVGSTSREINNNLPLPEADLPPEVMGPVDPRTQPNIPVAPLDNLGKMDAYRQQLIRRGVPRKEGEALMGKFVTDLNQGNDVAQIYTGTDGKPVAIMKDLTVKQLPSAPAKAPAGDPEVRQFRAEANQRANEDQQRQAIRDEASALKDMRKSLEDLGGGTGVFKKDGKYFAGGALGGREVSAEKGQRWLDLNDAIVQMEKRIADKRKGVSDSSSNTSTSNEKVIVIDPNGRRGTIPRSQLDAALQSGYKQAP